MKKAKEGQKNELLEQLARYGYELTVPSSPSMPPEKVLEAVLRQDDPRLLEGFPVVLVNALAEKEQLEWEKRDWSLKGFSLKTQARWTALMAASFFLYELFGWNERTRQRTFSLLKKNPQGEVKLVELKRLQGDEFKADGLNLSLDRLKTSFRNYVVHQAGSDQAARKKKEELEQELLLSELFTLKQKELLAKRLTGKPMTKTENEYYHRVVKKRLVALADSKLHQMARDLVYS